MFSFFCHSARQFFATSLAGSGPDNASRCSVLKDDFHANWAETEVVTADPAYKTNFGKLHYVQMFERDHPLIMRPGQVYRLSVSFDPDLTMVEA